jgi:hypothetical protein
MHAHPVFGLDSPRTRVGIVSGTHWLYLGRTLGDPVRIQLCGPPPTTDLCIDRRAPQLESPRRARADPSVSPRTQHAAGGRAQGTGARSDQTRWRGGGAPTQPSEVEAPERQSAASRTIRGLAWLAPGCPIALTLSSCGSPIDERRGAVERRLSSPQQHDQRGQYRRAAVSPDLVPRRRGFPSLVKRRQYVNVGHVHIEVSAGYEDSAVSRHKGVWYLAGDSA